MSKAKATGAARAKAKATGTTKARTIGATQATGVTKTTNAANPKLTQDQRSRSAIRPTSANKGPVRKGPTIRKKKHNQLYLVLGVLAVIVVIIGGFILLEHTQAGGSPAAAQPVNSTVLQEVTGVSPTTWEAIGTGGVTQPFTPVAGQAALKGSNGLPELLYIGGEYCPNCAAERWSLLNALSRFGTVTQVSQIQSNEGNISTFSFRGSSYTSQYLDFVPREIADNTANHGPLDTLTTSEQQIFNQDDSGGSIPFIDVGNRYQLVGASYSYTVLQDSASNAFSWQDIASSLGDTSSPIAQNILGTANYLTAAICTVDGQQPGSVCQVPAIQQIEQALGPSASRGQASFLASALLPADVERSGQSRFSRPIE